MADLTAAPEVDTEAIADFVQRAKDIEFELRKVIVGQHEAVRQVLLALFAGGHVLLEGVPGLGKTLLVRTLGEVLSLRFNRIQFTPDLMRADIVGTTIVSADGQCRRGDPAFAKASFRPGHPESARNGRHLPAARAPALPVFLQGPGAVS